MVGLASLSAACGEDAPALPPPAASPAVLEVLANASPPTSASALPPPISSAPRPPKAPPEREGDTSVEALFDRARLAIAEGDDATLVRCLEPTRRRAWLGDALLAIEVEVQIPRYEDELGRRRALGVLHDLVRLHVGAEGAGRPAALTPDAVELALLDRVKSPDALLAELLSASRMLGHPLDPVGAAQEGRVGPGRDQPVVGAPGPEPSPPAGLARALRRIERARDLAEVHLEDARGIALVRGADGGLEPVRLVRLGDTVWVDES